MLSREEASHPSAWRDSHTAVTVQAPVSRFMVSSIHELISIAVFSRILNPPWLCHEATRVHFRIWPRARRRSYVALRTQIQDTCSFLSFCPWFYRHTLGSAALRWLFQGRRLWLRAGAIGFRLGRQGCAFCSADWRKVGRTFIPNWAGGFGRWHDCRCISGRIGFLGEVSGRPSDEPSACQPPVG